MPLSLVDCRSVGDAYRYVVSVTVERRVATSIPGLPDVLRETGDAPEGCLTLDGVRVKIHDATLARDAAPLPAGQLESQAGRLLEGTASHPLELVTVQPAGRRSMAAADWWRGHSGSSQAELQ